MIFYFSGTGNSLHAARSVAAFHHDRLVSVADELNAPGNRCEYSFEPGAILGFVFPVYAWGPPAIVLDFIDRMRVTGAVPFLFCLTTCGGEEGSTSAVIARRLARKKLVLDAAFTVVMPNNYLIGYHLDDPSVQSRQLRQADERLTEINEAIRQRRKGISLVISGKTPGFLTALIHSLFNRFAIRTRPFYATDACTGCGRCERICPVHTIKVDGKPIWGKRCTQCLGCISRCPVGAIDYGIGTVGKCRFVHPELLDVGNPCRFIVFYSMIGAVSTRQKEFPMIKRMLADLILGLVLLVVMSLVQLLISSLFGDDGDPDAMVNLLFLASALPAGLITFGAAHVARLPSRRDAWIAAAILTGIHLLFNLLVGFGNETAGIIFGSIGFYVYTLLYFCGPVIYAFVRKLPESLPAGGHAATGEGQKNG